MPSSDFTRNQLLTAPPPADLDRLRPNLECVDLALKQALHLPGAPIGHVCFPDAGMVSLITAADENHAVEVGTIGREGLAGTAIILGADRAPVTALVQIPGAAARSRAVARRDERDPGAPGSRAARRASRIHRSEQHHWQCTIARKVIASNSG